MPLRLSSRLFGAGLNPLRQTPQPILNTSYNENRISYWLAHLIHAVAGQRPDVAQADADTWLSEFDALEQSGEYFFCAMPVINEVVNVT